MTKVWLTQLADRIRRYGMTVHEFQDWKTRSRSSGGFDQHPMAIIVHHDAIRTAVSDERRAELEYEEHPYAPVGNLRLNLDASVTVGAAGAANTAGRGGPIHTSRGVVPENMANRLTINIEASNDAGNRVPWPETQIDGYVELVAILCLEYDFDPFRDVYSHYEWTTGVPRVRGPRKWDPAGPYRFSAQHAIWTDNYWDMDAFRAAVAQRMQEITLMVPHKPDVVYDTRDRGDNLRAGEARRFAVAMGQTAQVRFSIIRPGQSANVEWLTYAPTEDELDLENTSVLSWGRVDPGETDLRPQIAMDVSCPDGHLWVASTVNTHLVITTLATGR